MELPNIEKRNEYISSNHDDSNSQKKMDTSEQILISPLALIKMIIHGRAGIPMEVMGLMLGEFVDKYIIHVVDVFAMPQSGTGVTVEAVDPVFQTKMLDMLKQVGRPEMVVGWYHSHPGFGCFLSNVDINTHLSFETLNNRAVAIVVDPIQSVKGKVVIDAFRSINPEVMLLNQEPRRITSNLEYLENPSTQAVIHGLNRHYYSIVIDFSLNFHEETILLNLNKKSWVHGLLVANCFYLSENNKNIFALKFLIEKLSKNISADRQVFAKLGEAEINKCIEYSLHKMLGFNIVQALGQMLGFMIF